MDEMAGRTAVVTGGGSGIGRGLALGLAREGMNVVVADIDPDAGQSVADEAAALGVGSLAVPTDVSDFSAVDGLAAAAWQHFGSVHVLCNNAGVLLMAPLRDMVPADWEWLFGVNVMGIVHGIHAFLPRLLAQGGPAHILNTGSVAGLGGGDVYGASKAAVMSISQSLHDELADTDIGVSVLLPANISSRITSAQRNRPERFGRKVPEPFAEVTDFGLDASLAAQRGIDAVKSDQLYAFVFPEGWLNRLETATRDRYGEILAALGRGVVTEASTPEDGPG